MSKNPQVVSIPEGDEDEGSIFNANDFDIPNPLDVQQALSEEFTAYLCALDGLMVSILKTFQPTFRALIKSKRLKKMAKIDLAYAKKERAALLILSEKQEWLISLEEHFDSLEFSFLTARQYLETVKDLRISAMSAAKSLHPS